MRYVFFFLLLLAATDCRSETQDSPSQSDALDQIKHSFDDGGILGIKDLEYIKGSARDANHYEVEAGYKLVMKMTWGDTQTAISSLSRKLHSPQGLSKALEYDAILRDHREAQNGGSFE